MANSKPPKARRIRMPGTRGNDDLNLGTGFLSLSFSRAEAMEGHDSGSILPPAFRSRLYGLFNQIEQEFEALYSENLQRIKNLSILKIEPNVIFSDFDHSAGEGRLIKWTYRPRSPRSCWIRPNRF